MKGRQYLLGAILMLLCLPATTRADDKNGVQRAAFHFNPKFDGNLNSHGQIFYYEQPAYDVRQKKCSEGIKKVKKIYKKAGVWAENTADGRMIIFIRVPVGKGTNIYKYGMADEQGNIFLQPEYAGCYYCPAVSKGMEEIPINALWKKKGEDESHFADKTFRLWHDTAAATILAGDGKQFVIFDLEGNKLAEIPDYYMMTYYHGYFIFGITDSDLWSAQHGQVLHITGQGAESYRNNSEKYRPFLVTTSDGKQVSKGEHVMSIMDNRQGSNGFGYYEKDADGILRQGMKLWGEQKGAIPPYFVSVDYDDENSQWMVKEQKLRNAVPYDADKHKSIQYFDEGERMFYRGGKKPEGFKGLTGKWFYDDAINFYSQALSQGDITNKPWTVYYFIESVNNKLQDEMISNGIEVNYLEDLSKNMYNYAMKHLEETKTSIETCTQTYPQLVTMLDAYDKIDHGQLFSESEKKLREDLLNRVKLSQSYQERMNKALETFYDRVTAHEAHEAEIYAAVQERLEQERLEKERLEQEAEQARLEQEALQQQQQQNNNANLGLMILDMVNQSIQAGMNSNTTTNGSRVNANPYAGTSTSTYSSDSSDDSGHFKKTVKKQITCETCHGNKKCTVCKGSGKSKATYKNGEHKMCDACSGSGECFICDGKGYKIRYEAE